MATEPYVPVRSNAHRTPVIVWLVVSQLIALASLLLWFVAAALSLMAFDGGVTTEATMWVGLIWAYPFLPVGCALGAWFLFWRHHDRAAAIISALPLLPPLAYLVFLLRS